MLNYSVAELRILTKSIAQLSSVDFLSPPLVISLSRLFLPHLFHIFSPFPVALVIPLFQVRDSSSHLESVSTVVQSLALPGAREESHLGAPPRVLAL